MPEWIRVTDVRTFLAERGVRNVGVHHLQMRKRIPWPVCRRCGLVALKNDPTRRALRQPCVVMEDRE